MKLLLLCLAVTAVLGIVTDRKEKDDSLTEDNTQIKGAVYFPEEDPIKYREPRASVDSGVVDGVVIEVVGPQQEGGPFYQGKGSLHHEEGQYHHEQGGLKSEQGGCHHDKEGLELEQGGFRYEHEGFDREQLSICGGQEDFEREQDGFKNEQDGFHHRQGEFHRHEEGFNHKQEDFHDHGGFSYNVGLSFRPLEN